jgi:hypothetical protein
MMRVMRFSSLLACRLVLAFALASVAVSASCKRDSKPADTSRAPDTEDKTGDDKQETPGNKDKTETTKQTPQTRPPGTAAGYGATFDNTCSKDVDCVLYGLHKCSACGCDDFAINTKERQRFAEVSEAFLCPPPDPEELEISCGGCPGFVPVCADGTCMADMR